MPFVVALLRHPFSLPSLCFPYPSGAFVARSLSPGAGGRECRRDSDVSLRRFWIALVFYDAPPDDQFRSLHGPGGDRFEETLSLRSPSRPRNSPRGIGRGRRRQDCSMSRGRDVAGKRRAHLSATSVAEMAHE